MTHEYQEHGSAVDVATSPVVQYGYADGSNNSVRPTYIIYPDGRQIDYDYGTAGGPNDLLSRIETLDDPAGSATNDWLRFIHRFPYFLKTGGAAKILVTNRRTQGN